MKRIFLFPLTCLAFTAFAQDKTAWYDVTEWGVEGRGWGGQKRLRWFDRFPAKAEKTVTKAVWNLSRHSA
ncbi:MAG TPA: SGNH/GDSL hydrolase N-terminal domain-containing protein, partial [Verrucomicrobiota bacterium]|nr:SGNH/GDSL hydrolase N-terminal domain-containing protein [Verrucomicrobiota bacterium]